LGLLSPLESAATPGSALLGFGESFLDGEEGESIAVGGTLCAVFSESDRVEGVASTAIVERLSAGPDEASFFSKVPDAIGCDDVGEAVC